MTTVDRRLARRLLVDHPLEAARLLERSNPPEITQLLAAEGEAVAADVLRYLDRSLGGACLLSWPEGRRAELLSVLDDGVAARLLRALPADRREELLSACSQRVAGAIRRLLKYPEGTAGALMDPAPPVVTEDATVGVARDRITEWPSRIRGLLFVVNRGGALAGMVAIEDLLGAAPETAVKLLIKPSGDHLAARADMAAIASHPGWRSQHTLPVIDRDGQLVGAMSHQTVHEIEGDASRPLGDAPVGVVVSEMYWTVMSALVEAIFRAVRDRDAPQGHEVRS